MRATPGSRTRFASGDLPHSIYASTLAKTREFMANKSNQDCSVSICKTFSDMKRYVTKASAQLTLLTRFLLPLAIILWDGLPKIKVSVCA